MPSIGACARRPGQQTAGPCQVGRGLGGHTTLCHGHGMARAIALAHSMRQKGCLCSSWCHTPPPHPHSPPPPHPTHTRTHDQPQRAPTRPHTPRRVRLVMHRGRQQGAAGLTGGCVERGVPAGQGAQGGQGQARCQHAVLGWAGHAPGSVSPCTCVCFHGRAGGEPRSQQRCGSWALTHGMSGHAAGAQGLNCRWMLDLGGTWLGL